MSTLLPNLAACFLISSVPTSAVVLTPFTIRPSSAIGLAALGFILGFHCPGTPMFCPFLSLIVKSLPILTGGLTSPAFTAIASQRLANFNSLYHISCVIPAFSWYPAPIGNCCLISFAKTASPSRFCSRILKSLNFMLLFH